MGGCIAAAGEMKSVNVPTPPASSVPGKSTPFLSRKSPRAALVSVANVVNDDALQEMVASVRGGDKVLLRGQQHPGDWFLQFQRPARPRSTPA